MGAPRTQPCRLTGSAEPQDQALVGRENQAVQLDVLDVAIRIRGELDTRIAPEVLGQVERSALGREVECNEEAVACEAEQAGARVDRPLFSVLKRGLFTAQLEQTARKAERRCGVVRLCLDVEPLGVLDERESRHTGGEAGALAGRPRNRRALGVAAVEVDDAVGRDLRVGQRQLFALEQKRRPTQRRDQHGRQP